jgi:hypothetical protein
MQYRENLEWLASRRIDDEIREHFVEENFPAREIGAPVPAIWQVGQFVQVFEEFGDDAVRSLHALRLQR